MKKDYSTIVKTACFSFIICLFSVFATAQVPQLVNFSATLRDPSGNILANRPVQFQLTVLDNASALPDKRIYKEHRYITTSVAGEVSLRLNDVTPPGFIISLANSVPFTAIPWKTGKKFLIVDIDTTNLGTFFNQDTVEIATVPFAFASDAVTSMQLTGATNGQVLKWNGTAWMPSTDNTSTSGNSVVVTPRLSGDGTPGTPIDFAQQGAATGQVLKYDGTNWTPGNDNGASYIAGAGINIAGTTISANQQLGLTGNILNISNGNSVILPTGTTYIAGSGINISGNTISNSAPDQTIALTPGSGVTITGSYPNFTISAPSSLGVPVGTIISYAGTVGNPPAGWLVCDGSIVTVSQYQNLFNVINTYWGAGNGSGSDFNLPDLRGMFLRGVTGTSPNDLDANSRTATNGGHSGNSVGSVQNDALQGHVHNRDPQGNYEFYLNSTGTPIYNFAGGTTGTVTSTTTTSTPVTDGANGTPRTSKETRPKNAYVYYLIKY